MSRQAIRCGLAVLAMAALSATGVRAAPTTGFLQTGPGPWDYNDTANWVGGTINGIWDSTLALSGGDQVVYFGADTVLSYGWSFSYSPNRYLTIRGDGAARLVTLGGNVLCDVNAPVAKSVTIGSTGGSQALNVDLGGASRVFTVDTVNAAVSLIFQNVISGTGGTYGITKEGVGELRLLGDNTFTGGVTLNDGTLTIGHKNALGAGTLTVGGAATLNVRASLTGANSVANDIALAGDLTLWAEGTAYPVTFTGDITGAGDLTVKGRANTVTLAGNNSYSGTTTFFCSYVGNYAQTLSLAGSSGVVVTGDLTVGTALAAGYYATVRLAGDERIADAGLVTLNESGKLDLDGFDETVGGLNLNGFAVGAGTYSSAADLVSAGASSAQAAQVIFDGGSLTVAVPEPATLAFLALGGLATAGAAAGRRRRRA